MEDEHEPHWMKNYVQKLALAQSAIKDEHFKQLLVRNAIPGWPDTDHIKIALDNLKLIIIEEVQIDPQGNKHYSLHLAQKVDTVKYAIQKPEFKMGEENA